MSSIRPITPAAALWIAKRHVESNAWPWSSPIVRPGATAGGTVATEPAPTTYEIWTRQDWWGDQIRVVVDARSGAVIESGFVASCLHQHHEA